MQSKPADAEQPTDEGLDETPCSACRETISAAYKTEMRYQKANAELKRLRRHLRDLEESLCDVREEVENEGQAYRIIPLSHQDSGVVLAVCESIGPTLIPITPWSGSMHLFPEQLAQLNQAMAEFSEPNDKVHTPLPASAGDETGGEV